MQLSLSVDVLKKFAIFGLFLIVLIGGSVVAANLTSQPKLVTPIPGDDRIRIVFVTPHPSTVISGSVAGTSSAEVTDEESTKSASPSSASKSKTKPNE